MARRRLRPGCEESEWVSEVSESEISQLGKRSGSWSSVMDVGAVSWVVAELPG